MNQALSILKKMIFQDVSRVIDFLNVKVQDDWRRYFCTTFQHFFSTVVFSLETSSFFVFAFWGCLERKRYFGEKVLEGSAKIGSGSRIWGGFGALWEALGRREQERKREWDPFFSSHLLFLPYTWRNHKLPLIQPCWPRISNSDNDINNTVNSITE